MKNILLFSVGLSPQIVTETIYYYKIVRKPPLRIDDIRIITDASCADNIVTELLPDGNAWLNRLAEDYHLDRDEISIPFENIHVLKDKYGKPLTDLLSAEENNAAVTQVFDIIQRLTGNSENRLIASVAGGRKTMSVIVGQAMQFYARPQDLLTHVIADSKIVGLKDFYYPTPVSKSVVINGEKVDYHSVKLHLDEIPFIRLRPILGEFIHHTADKSLMSLVKQAQKQIEDLVKPLKITAVMNERTLYIGKKKVQLPAKNFSIYTLLLTLKKEKYQEPGGDAGYIPPDILLEEKQLRRYLDIYSQIYPPKNIYVMNERDRIDDPHKRLFFFTPKWLQETRSKINSKLKKSLSPHEFAICQIQSVGGRLNTRYGIPAEGKNIVVRNQG